MSTNAPAAASKPDNDGGLVVNDKTAAAAEADDAAAAAAPPADDGSDNTDTEASGNPAGSAADSPDFPLTAAAATTDKEVATEKSLIASKIQPFVTKETECVNKNVVEFLKDHPHVCRFDDPDWHLCWQGMGKKVNQAAGGGNRTDAECRLDFEELREKRAMRRSNRWTPAEEEALCTLHETLGNRWYLIGRLIGRTTTDDSSLLRKYHRMQTKLEKKKLGATEDSKSPAAKRQKTGPAKAAASFIKTPTGAKINVDRFVEKVIDRTELVSSSFQAHSAVVGGRMEDLEYVWQHKDDETNKQAANNEKQQDGTAAKNSFEKVDSRGRNCLDLAAVLGRMEMVQWLLEKGMQFNAGFSYPFMMALARGDSWEQFCSPTATPIKNDDDETEAAAASSATAAI